MELVPIVAFTSLGAAFCLMAAAFVTAALSPRFPDAPPGSPPPGLWPRRLMLAGASLGAAFGLLMLLPGVLPWIDNPSDYADFCLSAAAGAGMAITTLKAIRGVTSRLGERKPV